MRALGISLGASSIGFAVIEKKKLVKGYSIPHEGNPKKVLTAELKKSKFDYIAATGRKFREFVTLPTITEPEATEIAYEFIKKEPVDAIVSAGGETFMVYVLDTKGKISNVYSGNKCASGTGEFFLQQIRRMDLDCNEAVGIAKNKKPHHVTGRCSVFCKSDCTHALNKGILKGEVTAGLCEMMAKKITELLARINEPIIMVVGGTSQNKVVMDYLRKDVKKLLIPKEAPYFEALGAALWAFRNKTRHNKKDLFKKNRSAFSFLRPLNEFIKNVSFKEIITAEPKEDDECIVGLDVGSTTTKAVIIRRSDNAILVKVYLRTSGDPVKASRNCYKGLLEQLEVQINITGLGVTGSGRHIAGLHALTDAIINEIIAHATAAVYFDSDVDTIFEIGGQDAKYTFITNQVASDYAMNEACSAGTGSFLEESAKESLNVDFTEIGEIALQGKKPPNFNDQCAAFISSDIKTASQEGIKKQDIIAGLVYSICMNYDNRVKGARPVGKKVFMQGGVCYNKAVPIAMAALTGGKIIVPPEPGLMGAFGVALELKERQDLGILQKKKFSLKDLSEREVEYKNTFKCAGGSENCDRGCEIMTIKVMEKTYPFGGSCDKYYNQRFNMAVKADELNLVKMRQDLIFKKYARDEPKKNAPTMGINRSFLTNMFYPLYYNFFTRLGLNVILSDKVLEEGTDKKGSAFCYPAEISHGFFLDLLKKKPDHIFLPIVLELPIKSKNEHKATCVFVQGEHAYLKTAFKKNRIPVISPVLNLSKGISSGNDKFIQIARDLGFSANKAESAINYAVSRQKAYEKEARQLGKKALSTLDKDSFAVVLFGRSYNAFCDEANMGIPHKFASRNTLIIPVDFLPIEKEKVDPSMYWGMGQQNLMAARYVKKHPNLYGAFITNFSCGPDSFIITYFRDIMGIKPSLTLELDSHTADAGLNTRIDAFLDIVRSYRELEKRNMINESKKDFTPAKTIMQSGNVFVTASNKKRYPLSSPKVSLLIPSMGRLSTEAMAAALRGIGLNAKPLPIPDTGVLQKGRSNSSCKECLPLQLTTGSILKYIEKEKKPGEIVVYFMPESSGPCRFGQYNVFMKQLIRKKRIKDVALLTLSDKNCYGGLGTRFAVNAWKAAIVSDVMADIYNALFAIAKDNKEALSIFEVEWQKLLKVFKKESRITLNAQIKKTCAVLKKIPLRIPFSKANKISLIGEIYVRRDELSRQGIIRRLAKRDIVIRNAPVTEWIYYINYLRRHKLGYVRKFGKKRIAKLYLSLSLQLLAERKIKRLFSKSGLYDFEMIDIKKTIDHAKHIVNRNFGGEAILTAGLGLREILHNSSGIISIGPFACMPSRVAEAVLTEEMTLNGKVNASKDKNLLRKYKDITCLPYLAIETDGNPYPQIIEARLETFCLQSERLHKKMVKFK